jgi:Fe-S cluster assembly ATPase SufC
MSKVLKIENLRVGIAGKEILKGVDLTIREPRATPTRSAHPQGWNGRKATNLVMGCSSGDRGAAR